MAAEPGTVSPGGPVPRGPPAAHRGPGGRPAGRDPGPRRLHPTVPWPRPTVRCRVRRRDRGRRERGGPRGGEPVRRRRRDVVDGADLPVAGAAGRDPGPNPSRSPNAHLTTWIAQHDRSALRTSGPAVSVCPVKLREQRVEIPAPDGDIQAIVIEPAGPPPRRGVLYYTDIFQLTESTLRTARQLASAGFLVCLPEIYPRALAGVALEYDDAGKQAGLAAAASTTTAQFDADCAAALDYLEQRDDLDEIDVVGFCLGGHLAFRAAFDPRVAATVCFYPTGLHNGALGADDAGSLAQAAGIGGRLVAILCRHDPPVPAEARRQ